MSAAPVPRVEGGRGAFLDRDGTLIADPGYLGDPASVRLLERAAEAVAALCDAGYRVVVASNQSGVARGLYDEAAVAAVNDRVATLLHGANPRAHVTAFYHCPHLPSEPGAPPSPFRRQCDCRKPLPGLITRAARELGLDLSRSIAIGDQPRDVGAALAAGCCRALLIGTGAQFATLHAAVASLLAERRTR